MVPEVKVVEHVYHVVRPVGVLFPQLVQYPHLDEGLVVEALLVADDFDCHVLVGFVVQRPDDLAEAALADDLEDFVPVADVVVDHLVVAAVVVVVARVEGAARFGVDFARVQPEVVHLGVLFNLLLFVVGQAGAVVFEGLWKRERGWEL